MTNLHDDQKIAGIAADLDTVLCSQFRGFHAELASCDLALLKKIWQSRVAVVWAIFLPSRSAILE